MENWKGLLVNLLKSVSGTWNSVVFMSYPYVVACFSSLYQFEPRNEM